MKSKVKVKASALIPLEVATVVRTVTIEDLIDDFYIHHKIKQKELYKQYRGEKFVFRPIGLVKNPPGFCQSGPTRTDVWVALYYRHYYVRVECGKSQVGPHKFELFWQMKKGHHIRLAAWQSSFFFHNERKLRKKLKLAILAKKFYASDVIQETLIEIEEEGDIRIDL